MHHRADPARIDAARHAATRNRRMGEGMTPEQADGWLARLTVQAAKDGRERDAEYWADRIAASACSTGVTR